MVSRKSIVKNRKVKLNSLNQTRAGRWSLELGKLAQHREFEAEIDTFNLC